MPRVTEDPFGITFRGAEDGEDRERAFHVEAGDISEARLILMDEQGLDYGTPYSDPTGVIEPNCRLRDFDIKPASAAQIGGIRMYRVRALFSSRKKRSDLHKPRPVVGSPAVYLWGRGEELVPAERDIDGFAMVHTNNKLVTPPFTRLEVHRFLTIKWYVAAVNWQQCFLYDGRANADNWAVRGRWNIVPGQAMSHGIDPDEEEADLILMTWLIEFKPGGALWTPLEYISKDKDPATGVDIKLGADGNPLPAGEDPFIITSNWQYTANFSTWGV